LIPYSIDWLSKKQKTLLASKSDAEMKEFIAVHLLKEVLLQSGGVYAVDGKNCRADSFGYYCNFSLSRRSCFRFHQNDLNVL
jgi:hypothetical protein